MQRSGRPPLTDWDKYLAPWIDIIVPGDAHEAMLMVGVIEVIAGSAVAVIPRYGALLVAAWLGGIIVNLVTMGEHLDVALRDFGLPVGALASLRSPSTAPRATAPPTSAEPTTAGQCHADGAAECASDMT